MADQYRVIRLNRNLDEAQRDIQALADEGYDWVEAVQIDSGFAIAILKKAD